MKMAFINLNDLPPSVEYAKKTAIFRRINRLEKRLDKTVAAFVNESEEKLRKRQLAKDAQLETESIVQDSSNAKANLKLHFIEEVDDKIRDDYQLKAEKQYYESHIEKNLPEWIRSLRSVKSIVESYGHANRLRWRSKTVEKLTECVDLAEMDPSSHDSRLQMKRLQLDINTFPSNQIIRCCDNIVSEYISKLESESDLGQSAIMLNSLKKTVSLNTGVVPLPAETWSENIKSPVRLDGRRTKKLLPLTLNCVDTLITRKMNSIHMPELFNKKDGSPHEIKDFGAQYDSEGDVIHIEGPHRPKLQPSDYPNISDMVAFRQAATEGQFDKVMKMFSTMFKSSEPHKIRTEFKLANVTMDIFRVLMSAFKNSKIVLFENAYKVLDLMEKYGFKPDITLYNSMLQACESNSRWRRGLAIFKEMKRLHKLNPNSSSMQILLNCCRYCVDEPSVVYETLREARLPQK